jgi:hypothetical protein
VILHEGISVSVRRSNIIISLQQEDRKSSKKDIFFSIIAQKSVLTDFWLLIIAKKHILALYIFES